MSVELQPTGPPPPIPPRDAAYPTLDKAADGGSVAAPSTASYASPAPAGVASSQGGLDPYEEDRQRSRCAYLWYRWVNPWCRMLLIVVVLYLYVISSGVLTYRNNDFQDQMQRLVNTVPNPSDPTATYPGDPPSTRPEREDDPSAFPYPYLDGRTYVPFILRDLWFDFIPALQGDTRVPWSNFADATPIIWNVIMLLMLLIRMDVVRWSEYIAIQWILFAVNALVHVSTTYPDATGYQSSCRDPDKHVSGGWMWHYVTTASAANALAPTRTACNG